ncbi:MAG: B12-binding domain-containing radical SAM protein [Bdellovibrionales bacterium]|nr:B12-binding domain-containing radical SAM protein [Bdellovibrionales bacterium]
MDGSNLKSSSGANTITLVRPSIIYSATAYSTPVTLPIGLAYIASLLRKYDYKVEILDCLGLDINQVVKSSCGRFKIQGASFSESLNKISPETDILGVSVMFSQEWLHIKKFIIQIKQNFPKVKIVVGGEHATALPEYCLRDCPEIDFVITGEGEQAFLALCSQLRKNIGYENIPGLAYLKENQFFQNQGKRIIEIDKIPWPAWDLLDLEPYFRPNFTMGISHGRNMPILATRGCPYQCTFCSNVTMWTTKYIMRDPIDVVDEIEYNQKQFQANGIDFFDLTAIVKKGWIMEFTNELKRRNIKIPWSLPSGTRSEALDDEVLKNLKDTGMELLVYAPENGSNRILKEVKKKVNLKSMIKSIISAKKHNLTVKLNLVIGFPTEKRIDVFKTSLMMWKLAFYGVDDADLSIFSPYPGSELFQNLYNEKKIEKIDDSYFEDLLIMYDFTFFKSHCDNISGIELNIYRVFAMSIFYLISYLWWPKRILRFFPIIFLKKKFIPRSIFEQRVYDILARFRLEKGVN